MYKKILRLLLQVCSIHVTKLFPLDPVELYFPIKLENIQREHEHAPQKLQRQQDIQYLFRMDKNVALQ